MTLRHFPPALVSIQAKRASHPRHITSLAKAFITGLLLSLALSGCGVFCNIGGGSGGIGGSCGVGTGFRF